jgi:hypothetical protein
MIPAAAATATANTVTAIILVKVSACMGSLLLVDVDTGSLLDL